MLDNMDCSDMAQAVEMTGGRAKLEASGNITLENIREVAETGVDIISLGAAVHCRPLLACQGEGGPHPGHREVLPLPAVLHESVRGQVGPLHREPHRRL